MTAQAVGDLDIFSQHSHMGKGSTHCRKETLTLRNARPLLTPKLVSQSCAVKQRGHHKIGTLMTCKKCTKVADDLGDVVGAEGSLAGSVESYLNAACQSKI